MTSKTQLQEVPKVEKAVQFLPPETLKIALYSDYGRGKTEQLGQLIESVGMENCVIVSCDDGLGTIKSVVDYSRVISAYNWEGMQDAYKFTKERIGGQSNKWALVDGGTSLLLAHVNLLFAATEEAYDFRARKQPIPDALVTASRYLTKNDQVDGQAIYGRVGRDLTRLFQTWKALGTNLVFTFLEELTGLTDKREKTYPFGPAIPGNIGYRAAMSTFDFVVRLWWRSNDSALMAGTKATNMYEARIRQDRRTGVEIPPTIENFDLAQYVKLIQQTTKEQTTHE